MSDQPDNVVLELLRALGRDNADMRALLQGLVAQGQRLERRMGELDRRMTEMRDDIELMLKAELMGRLGNFEARLEGILGPLSERVTALESQ